MIEALPILSWRLWRALRQPPRNHPLYCRVASQREPVQFLVDVAETASIFAITGLYSIMWALGISFYVSEERETHRCDLLNVMPPGTFGAIWTIGIACLHRNRNLDKVNARNVWIARATFVVMLLATGLLTPYSPEYPLYTAPLYLAAFMFAIYIDHIHNIVLGVLLGMVIATFVKSLNDARLWTPLVALSAQMTAYALSLLIGFSLLPMIYTGFGFHGVAADISLILLRVGVFFGIREWFIVVLWRVLTARLHADPAELSRLGC